MEFKQHAKVITAEGDTVGHVDRVVVDSATKNVTHIVVVKGFLFSEDKVVPIHLVADAADDQIRLVSDAGDLQDLPHFEEAHYVPLEDSAAGAPVTVVAPAPLGFPAAYEALPRHAMIRRVEQNIPVGTVALKEGAKVMTLDGKRLGKVERVVVEPGANAATHLLVTTRGKIKTHKLIPMTWVTIQGENEVRLTVGPLQLEELGEYKN